MRFAVRDPAVECSASSSSRPISANDVIEQAEIVSRNGNQDHPWVNDTMSFSAQVISPDFRGSAD